MKKTMRVLSVLMIVLILISAFSMPASAYGITYYKYKGFVYTDDDVTSKNSVRITNYKGKKTKVTIPTKIKGKKVQSISGYGKIKQLHIPNGIDVLYIAKAKNLKKITVSKTNKKYSVKNNLLLNKNKTVLYGCPRGNSNPKIPSTVKTIDGRAFYGAKFKEITLLQNVKNIGTAAFAYCKKLVDIKLSKALNKIGTEAFTGCTSLKSITIPDSVTSIGIFAFSHCKNLESVKLSENIKFLDTVFNGCESLKELEIPKSVTKIADMAMYDCKSLEKVYIYNKNCKIYYEADGGILNAIPKTATIYGYKGSTAEKYANKNGNIFIEL